MSTKVDERVVSMQFDNRHFEKNVQTSMSTLDKLKQKLNFTGASKGLDNLGTVANKVNMSGLNGAVDTVCARFSALEVMGVTALANITNSAVNAGKRIVSSLTIEPVKTGFNEYELKMNSIQTIMASTGESLDTVNKYLEELNEYSDQTIYSFQDMTSNIGKFTNAGVNLEDAVMAIKGVSNEAAVSGANANEASRAMYNFAQALSAGYVKLIDWKSIENANMATVEFKNQLIETAVELGTVTKTADGMYKTLDGNAFNATKNFNEVLQDQWMTTEVLIGTLKDYADESTEIGKKAKASATEVKTFTMMMDTLRESAQSGWAQTWEIIVGDFHEAKNLWTNVSDFVGDLINTLSDTRNALLESALGKGFTHLIDGFNSVIQPVEKLTEVLYDLDEIADRVIKGDFGNNPVRFERLTEAGYNYYAVQNKVNEKLNNSYRHSQKLVDAQDELLGSTKKTVEGSKELSKTTSELTQEDKERLKVLMSMTEEELIAAGYNETQIALLKELGETAKRIGVPINEFIDNLEKINGRWLLIDTFKILGTSIVEVFKAMGDAWSAIFPSSIEKKANMLFNFIAGLHRFANALRVDEDRAEKFRKTFEGVFAILDIVLTIVGGPLKIAFKALTQLLGMFDLDILDVTASIGTAIVKFRDWLDATLDFTKVFEKVIPPIQNAIKAIKEWISGLKESKNLPQDIARGIVRGFGMALDFIVEKIAEFKDGLKNGFDSVPGNMVSGIVNGLRDGMVLVGQVMIEFGKMMLEKICDVLGIQSPSKEGRDIGMNFMLGIWEGIKEFAGLVWDAISNVGKVMLEKLANITDIDIGKVMAAGLGVGLLLVLKQLLGILNQFTSPLEGLGDMFEGLGDMFEGIGARFKAKAWELRSKALLNMAFAIGILTASLVVLTKIDGSKLKGAVGTLLALSLIIAGLMTVITLLGKIKVTQIGVSSGSLLGISASLLILVIALKKLESVNLTNVDATLKVLGVALGGLVAVLLGLSLVSRVGDKINMSKIGGMFLKMSLAMLLMIKVIEIASSMTDGEVKTGIKVVGAVAGLFVVFMAASLMGKNAANAGKILLRMSIAMLLMVGIVKLASGMSKGEVNRGLSVVGAIGGLFALVIAVSALAGKNSAKAGAMILMMSMAMLTLVGVVKLASWIDKSDIKRGLTAMAGIGAIFVAVIAISKLAGQNAIKAGVMLVAMSTALMMLTGVLFIIGQFDPEKLWRAVGVVAVLEALFGGLIAITKIAKDTKEINGVLLKIVIAIGTLAVAVGALSFIDPSRLAGATAAISTIMLVLIGLLAVTKYVNVAKGINSTMWSIVGIILVLGGIITAMSLISNPDAAIKSAGAISILLLSLVGALAIFGHVKIKAMGPTILKEIGVLIGVITALAIIVGLMNHFGGTADVTSVVGIAGLLLAMAGVLVVLGMFPTTAIPNGTIGMLFTLSGVIAILAVIIGLLNNFGGDMNVGLVVALGALLLEMTVVTAILSAAGAAAGTAIAGAAALIVIVSMLGLFAVGLGHVMSLISPETMEGIETGLDRFISIMGKLGESLGAFVGGVLGGLLDGVASGLSSIADTLCSFIEKMIVFIDSCSAIDETALTNIRNLSEAILILTAAALLDGIASFISGESSMTGFAEELPKLATGLNGFVANLGEFDETKAATVGIAAGALKTLADMASTIPNSGGLLGLIVGNNDMGGWAEQLPKVGLGLWGFMSNLGEFDKTKAESIGLAAGALKTLAEMASEIPNSGGLLGDIVGNNDMGGWAAQLPKVATGLRMFSVNLGPFDEDKATTIGLAAGALKTLADMASDIPNSGGLLGDIVGNNDMGGWADQLPKVGLGLWGFINNLGAFDEADVITVTCASQALAAIAEAAKNIPNEGGLLGLILGDNDLGDWAENLPAVADGIAGFMTNLGDIDVAKTTVDTACAAISSLASLSAGEDVDLAASGRALASFGSSIETLGWHLATFATTLGGTDFVSISASVRGLVGTLTSVSNECLDLFTNAFTSETATSAVTTAASTLITKFTEAIELGELEMYQAFAALMTMAEDTVELRHDEMETAGEEVAIKFVDGISSELADVETEFTTLLDACIERINGYETVYYNAGADLVEGFADGISETTFKASAKAAAMARAAINAAMDELDENSPSKVFYEIGAFGGIGFVNALDDYAAESYRAGSGIAEMAKDGLGKAISTITDVINSDMDTQPTIRPVLDLSDVRSGASTINGILDMAPSVGVMTNVRAINSMMNNQNGVNDDVVSAIKALGSQLGGRSGDTYQINGITYDDGSNITSAVRTLVRAAKIERRT